MKIILLTNIDSEDYWLIGQIAFKIPDSINQIEDAYLFIKEQLEQPETIQKIIDQNCLFEDLFCYDDSFKFKESVLENFKIELVFENSEGENKIYTYSEYSFLTIIE